MPSLLRGYNEGRREMPNEEIMFVKKEHLMTLRRKVPSRLFMVAVSALVLSLLLQFVAQEQLEASTKGTGHFYLVGMGPGDPDLATFGAMRVVQEADLIICCQPLKERFSSALKDKEIMTIHGGKGVWFGYGKKASDFHGKELKEFQASEKLRGQVIASVRRAVEEKKTVAVLDSGDPLIYGRWTWCLEEFQDLDSTVVPGLSCFNAAHAVLKKDITWSDTVKSTILTANDWPGKRDRIEKLAEHQVTMVIFTMGLELEKLVAKLSTHYPPYTPVAIVCHAGYQKSEGVIKGTLGTILDKIPNKKLPFEHLVYVGEMVNHKWKK